MVQLDLEDVILTPQEQIDWNALTQSETDEFDQMLRDMALIPSPLWDQAMPGVCAVPADEGCSQTITSAQQEGGKEKDEEERGEEEKGKGEEDEQDEGDKAEEREGKEEREEASEIPKTNEELLALPFKELTLTEFERVERIFFEQAAVAAVAEAAKAAEEAEAAAEVERKSNKEKELKLLNTPFSMLSLTQFEDVERLFLNGGVPAELIPAIPTRRAPVEEPKQAEVNKAKETLLDFEEVESSFSDVEMFVMPIIQNKEQTERYASIGSGVFSVE